MSADTAAPTPPPVVKPGLVLQVRAWLSLPRVQAIFGITAALLSIGGALYGYLRPGRTAPIDGEIVAIVSEAKSGKPLPDATVELLTPKNALVTMLTPTGSEARHRMKEGLYQLRVTHPRYATEVRQIQVLTGQTAEVHIRLNPRPAPAASPSPDKTDPLEGFKKIFR